MKKKTKRITHKDVFNGSFDRSDRRNAYKEKMKNAQKHDLREKKIVSIRPEWEIEDDYEDDYEEDLD